MLENQRGTRECSFDIGHFRWIVHLAKELGYGIRPLKDWALGMVHESRTLFLRHDIDVSPALACRLAEVEVELGIRSSYFVRLRARYYNPLTSVSSPHLRWMADEGFEIGVHYEPRVYQERVLDPVAALRKERDQLQELTQTRVYGASAHMPSTYGLLPSEVVRAAGLLYEASEPTTDGAEPHLKYLSDSGRRWREGCICQWLGKVDRLAVLIHPVWWLEPEERSEEIITRLRRGE